MGESGRGSRRTPSVSLIIPKDMRLNGGRERRAEALGFAVRVKGVGVPFLRAFWRSVPKVCDPELHGSAQLGRLMWHIGLVNCLRIHSLTALLSPHPPFRKLLHRHDPSISAAKRRPGLRVQGLAILIFGFAELPAL